MHSLWYVVSQLHVPDGINRLRAGLSLALFGVTVWALVYKRATTEVNRLMCTAAVLLFLLSTLVRLGLSLFSDYFHLYRPA